MSKGKDGSVDQVIPWTLSSSPDGGLTRAAAAQLRPELGHIKTRLV